MTKLTVQTSVPIDYGRHSPSLTLVVMVTPK